MKHLALFCIYFFLTFFISCKKKEDHSIRFVNHYSYTISQIKAGQTDLGTVSAGQSSAFYSINTGNFEISGNSPTGYLAGSGNITGTGTHQWSIILNENKILTLVQEN